MSDQCNIIDRLSARSSRAPFVGVLSSSVWAVSSAVEHYVDIVGVTGSIPVPPTSWARLSKVKVLTCTAKKKENLMKVKNSLRSLKQRHRDCRVVRRRGRIYVINKTQRRFKARQG